MEKNVYVPVVAPRTLKMKKHGNELIGLLFLCACLIFVSCLYLHCKTYPSTLRHEKTRPNMYHNMLRLPETQLRNDE